MTQPPEHKALKEKRRVESAGFVSLYDSPKKKMELSIGKTVLRIKICKDGWREKLYYQVEDKSRIRNIEYRSENWKKLSRIKFGKSWREYTEYVLMEQRDAYENGTGYYKLIITQYVNGEKKMPDYKYYAGGDK